MAIKLAPLEPARPPRGVGLRPASAEIYIKLVKESSQGPCHVPLSGALGRWIDDCPGLAQMLRPSLFCRAMALVGMTQRGTE